MGDVVLELMNLVRRRLGLYMEGVQEWMDLHWTSFRLRYTKLGLKKDTNFLSPGENTALHLAARKGDKSVVEKLLNSNKFLLTEKNIKRDTPLHLAACSGHVDVVRSLIRHAEMSEDGVYGVISVRNMKGNTPLHEAVRNGHYWVALVLVDKANHSDLLVSVNEAGESPLSMAIDVNRYHIMEKILEAEPSSLLHRGPNNRTLLHRAILRADIYTIKFLVKKSGELIFEEDSYGRTPLHYAAASGAHLAVHHLLKVDASIALLQDHHQATPAHLAAECNRKHTLSIVLSRCPHSVELLNKRSQNILHVAAQNGCVEVVEYTLSLPEADDLMNERDKDGNTPLHLAAMNFHSSVVRDLTLKSKVDIRAINKDGKTALDIAQDYKRSMTTKKSLFKVFQLKEDNFKNWSIQMKTFLDSKDVWDVIERGYEVPADEYNLSRAQRDYISDARKKDKQALSFIYQAIDENTFEKISHANTAKEAWKILKDSYKTVDKLPSQERAADTSSDMNDDDKINENELIIEFLKEVSAKKAENLEDIPNREKPTFKLIKNWSRSKELPGSLMVMAILIATVAFSAGFNIPRGFQSQDPHKGMAVQGSYAALRTFIITDTIAMISAMMAVVLLILTPLWSDKEINKPLLYGAISLLWVGLATMGLAYVAALRAVFSDSLPSAVGVGVTFAICVFPFVAYASAFIMNIDFSILRFLHVCTIFLKFYKIIKK